MKSKVIFSKFAITLTILIPGIMVGSCMACYEEKPAFLCLLSALLFILIIGFLYGPIAIKTDDRYITVKCVMKNHKISMFGVKSVELFQPTLGAIRIYASGGYMGYWGMFREGDIGRYMAYYGKSSDCFLVRMKNGDKYVLGCKNPAAMVDYIQSKIS